MPVVFTMVSMLCLAGCFGGQEGPPVGKVVGVVTMNGQPAPQTRVLFEPQANAGPSWGLTDSNGKFEVYYTLETPGAVVGKHRVQFQALDQEEGTAPAVVIPANYAIGSKGIEVDVVEGSNDFSFELAGK